MNNELDNFIKNNDCDYSRNIISSEVLKMAEDTIGIKFGNQLSEYLLKYGYLGYKSVELYGMNSNQGLNSDLFEIFSAFSIFSTKSTCILNALAGTGTYWDGSFLKFPFFQ